MLSFVDGYEEIVSIVASNTLATGDERDAEISTYNKGQP
jgi:hypothetical protein